MNYFDELLESYNKLKKRTFKLVYLNEDEESAKANAEAKVRVLLSGPGSLSDTKGRLIQVLPGNQADQLEANLASRKAGEEASAEGSGGGQEAAFVINWAGFGRGGTIYYNSPEEFETNNNTQFVKLVGALINPDVSQNFEDQSDIDIKKLMNREGTAYDVAEINEILPEIYKNINRIRLELADEFGANPTQANIKSKYKNASKTFINLIQNPDNAFAQESFQTDVFNFVEGANGLGKVFDEQSKYLEGDEEDSGSSLQSDVNPPLVFDTLQALNKVLSYISNPNESGEDCESLQGIVSNVRGFRGSTPRTLLKLPGSSEGMIIPFSGFLPSVIKSKLNDNCPDATENVNVGSVSSKRGISAKKGTMHESLTKLLYLLHVARTSKGDVESINEDLRMTIKKNKEVVESLVDSMKSSSGWVSVDESLSDDLLKFEYDLFNKDKKNEELNNFLRTYYMSQVSLFNQVNADTMIHSGKTSLTGDRKDNVFVFKDEESARMASERLGVTYTKTSRSKLIKGASNSTTSKRSLEGYPKELYSIGLGQKLYNELHGSKAGEINSITRANDAAMGNLEGDPNVVDGFTEEMENRFPKTKATQSVFKTLNNQAKLIRNLLTEKSTTKGPNGKINKSDPVSIAKSCIESLKSNLSYDSIMESRIKDLDISTDYGRAKLSEIIERENQLSTIDSLLKGSSGDTKTATTMILRLAFSCGGNKDDILQSVYTQDDNKVHTYSHNYVFNAIGKDLKNVSIVRSGSGFNIEYKGLKVRLNLEATGSSKGMSKSTRTWLEMRKDTVRLASEDLQESIKQNLKEDLGSDLEELFYIQNKLLSKLLG